MRTGEGRKIWRSGQGRAGLGGPGAGAGAGARRLAANGGPAGADPHSRWRYFRPVWAGLSSSPAPW